MATNVKKDNLTHLRNKAIKSSVFTFYKKATLKLSDTTSSLKEVFDAIRHFESNAAKAARKKIIGQKSSAKKVSKLVLKAKEKFGQFKPI